MKAFTKTKLLVLLYFSFLFNQQLFCQNNVVVINLKCLPQNYHPAPSNYLNSKQDCSNALAVPSYLWSYGCLPTSAAMILGYYDRTGYSCCYTGSINGGLAPFVNGKTFPPDPILSYLLCKNPMSASVKGFDGRTINGHVDDFWVSYGSSGNDPHPWIGNTPPHDFTISPCAADYMGSNQDYWNTSDFNTQLMLFSSGVKTIDYTGMENSTPRVRDGNHGLRLLFEELGYTVLENFNQYIKGKAPNSSTVGFTFEEYKAEIDAGRPVILLITNNSDYHAMIGHGYNTCNGKQTLWVLDTWNDYSTFMDWGGTYQGMYLYGVSVIKLSPLSKSSGTCIATPVGINDIVKITNPPQGSPYPQNTLNFALGSTTSFYAKFTSYKGNTYPTNWSWTMELYHDAGSYTISSSSYNIGLGEYRWTPTISTSLPNYSWIRDEYGNISGKVTVTVHINDGDYKSDDIRVSVNSTPIPSAPTNLAYSATTYCSTTLSWSGVTGVTGYNVYNSTAIPATKITTTAATSYTVSGLSANTSYSFYITAVGSSGESNPSSSLAVTTSAIPTPTIAGSSIVCSSGTTFTINNLPSGYTVSWNQSTNLNRSFVSGNSATFTANGSGNGWIQATFSSGCGNVPIPQKLVWVGLPAIPIIDGANNISCGGTDLYMESNHTSVQWSIASPFRIIGSSTGYKCNVQAPSESYDTWLYATASNSCGASRGELEIQVSCDYYYSVFPNPANSELSIAEVSKKSISSNGTSHKLIKSVRVVDKFGNTLYFRKFGGETFESKLNISNFPIGVYIIKINEGKDEECHTIVKQ